MTDYGKPLTPAGFGRWARIIPVGEIERRMTELGGLERNPVVLVCRTDKRSASAARTLCSAGFTQVSVLRQGMEQYNAAGISVEERALDPAA